MSSATAPGRTRMRRTAAGLVVVAAQAARRTGDLAGADEPARPASPAHGDDEARRRSRQSGVRL